MNKQKREELKRKIAAQPRKEPPILKSMDRAIELVDEARKALNADEAKEIANNLKGGSAVVVRDSVTHTCGHKTGIAQLESIACTGCIAANKRARWERKKAAKAKLAEAVPTDAFRLPDGSTYVKSYNAATKTWTASLTVTMGDKPRQFTASGPASIKVEFDLDRMYREAVKESNV